jgi:hypothetical protein
MNLALFEKNSNESPFDSIIHYDNQGNEFWVARELMTVMGYTRWENFETAISSAIENLELAGDVVHQHFRGKVKKSKGRPSNDYQVTRYGCYMTALSCDGRKPEVALAKKYFAVKAREAEVKIPQLSEEIEVLKLKLALANAEKERSIAEKNLIDTRHYISTALPEPMQQKILGYQVVEKVVEKTVVYKESEFLRDSSTYNKTKLCNRYGILTKNGKPDYIRLNRILGTVNLPSTAWKKIKDVQENLELKSEYLEVLDDAIEQDSRQLWIGE